MFVASHKHDGMPRAVASLSDDSAGEWIFKIVSALRPQIVGIAGGWWRGFDPHFTSTVSQF